MFIFSDDAKECLIVAKSVGNDRIVGIDASGKSVEPYLEILKQFKSCGFKLTLHMGEVSSEAALNDDKLLIELNPDRIGHAVFLVC